MLWSSILKVLKVTSLQSPYNISKKKLGMEFISCMQINTSFCKLPLLFLMEVARHVRSTQNGKLVIFCSIQRKKCCDWFCVLLWLKTFRYFMLLQLCLLLLVYIIFRTKSKGVLLLFFSFHSVSLCSHRLSNVIFSGVFHFVLFLIAILSRPSVSNFFSVYGSGKRVLVL